MFNFLLNKSNIGTYNKCEIIEIFGMKKNCKIPFNIFTLIVFENTKQIDIEGLMSEKLQKFENMKDIITPPPNNLKNQQAYFTLGC